MIRYLFMLLLLACTQTAEEQENLPTSLEGVQVIAVEATNNAGNFTFAVTLSSLDTGLRPICRLVGSHRQ